MSLQANLYAVNAASPPADGLDKERRNVDLKAKRQAPVGPISGRLEILWNLLLIGAWTPLSVTSEELLRPQEHSQ